MVTNKGFSKVGIIIVVLVLGAVVFSVFHFRGDLFKKKYPKCGTGVCTLRTDKHGIEFCVCKGRPSRAKMECCKGPESKV